MIRKCGLCEDDNSLLQYVSFDILIEEDSDLGKAKLCEDCWLRLHWLEDGEIREILNTELNNTGDKE